MESMPLLVPEAADNVALDQVIMEKGVGKCSKKFGDSLPVTDVDAILETSDIDCYTGSEWVGSEDSASACSLESDASSNAISGNSLLSDADSLAPSCEDQTVRKCPSGGSIVTYDEAISQKNSEGHCKAGVARQIRGKCHHTDAQLDEQDTSISTVPRMVESAGKAWTDDKHCSYLNSIEATFVRSLYEPDYRAVDMSEQDQDCVESRPRDPDCLNYNARGELFISLQRGCYVQREYYRPHDLIAPAAPAVFASPWIQHFNPRIVPPGTVAGGTQDVFSGHTSSSSGHAEGIHCSNYVYQGVMEEVMESVPVLPDAPQRLNNRYQSQLHAYTSSPVRPDLSIPGKKRAFNLNSCADGLYRSKKLKSTQQKLAETDLELEEQFALRQLNQREDGNRTDVRGIGWCLDGSSSVRRPKREDVRIGAKVLQDTPCTQSAANGKWSDAEEVPAKEDVSKLRESEEDRRTRGLSDKHHDCEIFPKRCVDPSRKDNCGTSSRQLVDIGSLGDGSARIAVDCSVDHDAGVGGKGSGMNVVELVATQPAPSRMKIALDESDVKFQLDAEYDDLDECNFVPKISSRACRTYTWGPMGTRRPLLSGSAKDTKEETKAK